MANRYNDEIFAKAFKSLNPEQKAAVLTIDGPVLVIAGPGTGKTQLLATRIGHILKTTDAGPENILCLTFSESAVKAMKQRLADLIGPEAYNIEVSTYHAFGSNLLTQFPDMFMDQLDSVAADELAQDKLLREIQSELPYNNPLKDEYYLKDIKDLISGYKKALLTPDDLDTIAHTNHAFISAAADLSNKLIDSAHSLSKKQIPAYERLFEESLVLPETMTVPGIIPLKTLWLEDLEQALNQVKEVNRTPALTRFKTKWLGKDKTTHGFVLKCQTANRRIHYFTEVYREYNAKLAASKLYDYDDMIMLAIKGLGEHPEIKSDLQERYLYIQLDEFQDTNASQLRLIELLADNAANENRPNILAVGDDDQAIYSFQGAHYSNMERFFNLYRQVKLITLKTNYRSTSGIIHFAESLSNQIQTRLELTDKAQVSHSVKAKEIINRVELPLDVEQLAWTADYVADLISKQTTGDSIAIIAPKHEQLEELVPYLHAKHVALNYERKDNVLENPLIKQLITAARLVLSAGEGNEEDALWPQVLSFEYWRLPTTLIWELVWETRNKKLSWLKLLLQRDNTKPIAVFFLRLHQIFEYEPFEQILNYLIGISELDLNQEGMGKFISPFFGFYFNERQDPNREVPVDTWRLLGALSVLVAKAKASSDHTLNLKQFIEVIDDYTRANIKIEDKSPFRESEAAVNLMTAHASKGQEFNTVILIDVCDNVWGRSAKNRNNRITLPNNLEHVRHGSRNDDELLRLLFVAVTRAKNHLILTGYREKINGQTVERLGYLGEHEEEKKLISPLLPQTKRVILLPKSSALKLSSRHLEWFDRHLDTYQPKRHALLTDRLQLFNLSATNLNKFTDIKDGGPQKFYLEEILKFPRPITPRLEYGSVVHGILDWYFKITRQNDQQPTLEQIKEEFLRRLSKRRLSQKDIARFAEQGQDALTAYFTQTGTAYSGPDDLSETGFKTVINGARLTGNIDRLVINKKQHTLRIIDFKTGTNYNRWGREIKPYHHKRQLYFYKLLVETSPQFKEYTVSGATVQFVEPDPEDGLIKNIDLDFEESESKQLIALITAVWRRIINLDFPDTSEYPKSLAGITKFETDLVNNTKL
jgi:DNA helicase-2/ATP-dependent DNA helicase PcrA